MLLPFHGGFPGNSKPCVTGCQAQPLLSSWHRNRHCYLSIGSSMDVHPLGPHIKVKGGLPFPVTGSPAYKACSPEQLCTKNSVKPPLPRNYSFQRFTGGVKNSCPCPRPL